MNFPRLQDIMFITESEAAAVYTARHYRDELAQTILQVSQTLPEKPPYTKLKRGRKGSTS